MRITAGKIKWKKKKSPGSSMRRTAFLSPYLVNSCLWWIYQIWFISPLIFHIALEYILLQSDVIGYCCLQMHTCTHAHTWQEEVSPRGRPIKLSCLLVQQSTMTGRPITSVNHVIPIIPLYRSYTKTASRTQAHLTLWYIIQQIHKYSMCPLT